MPLSKRIRASPCHAHTSCAPLQVNLKLFQAAPSTNKTVLLIAIRDRTRTPHAKLCEDMRGDLNTIWAALVKPPEYADSSVEDFFELQYVSLPSYETQADDFVAEATILRRRFMPSYDDAMVRVDEAKVLLGCHCAPVTCGSVPCACAALSCRCHFYPRVCLSFDAGSCTRRRILQSMQH